MNTAVTRTFGPGGQQKKSCHHASAMVLQMKSRKTRQIAHIEWRGGIQGELFSSWLFGYLVSVEDQIAELFLGPKLRSLAPCYVQFGVCH